MRNDIFTTTNIAEYTVQGPTGLSFGTFAQWEHAQHFAQHNTALSSTGELLIMRGGDTLEIVREGCHVLSLVIVEGVCKWCEVGGSEVVRMPDGKICQGCSEATEYGTDVWDYLRS